MTTDPKDPDELGSSSDPNSSGSNASTNQGDKEKAVATKARVSKAWKRFQPVLYVVGFIFVCFLANMLFQASPRLRAVLGQYLSSGTDAHIYLVQQQSLIVPTGKKLAIQLSGKGSKSCHVTLYKYDKDFSPVSTLDPLHVFPNPQVSMSQITAKQIRGTVVWESNKTLRYADFDQYQDVLEMPDNLAPGDYFYTLSMNGTNENVAALTAAGSFRVSDISILIKTAPDQLLVRVFNVKTMKAVESANVRLFTRSATTQFIPGASLKSDADGMVHITAAQTHKSESPEPILVVESGENRASIADGYGASQDWNSSLAESPVASGASMQNDVLDIITDKPIYRLGQTVMYKAFLRRLKISGGYEAPLAGQDMPIEIRDPEGNSVQSTAAKTGAFGDVAGSFSIPADGKTGTYLITPTNYPNAAVSIDILQYRKPEYEVAIEPEQSYFLAGQKAKAKLTAKYFFGGPVAGAKVSYTINRSVSWGVRDRIFGMTPAAAFFGISAADRYSRSNPATQSYTEASAPITGTGLTDDKGELEIEFDTKRLSKDSPYDEGNQAQDYNISATITDISRKSVDTSGDALATPGKFALSLETSSYAIKPGQKIIAKSEAKDYDGDPVVQRNVEFSLEKWSYDSQKKNWNKIVVATANGSTDANGTASSEIQVPPDYKGYELLLCARAKDSDGNAIQDYSSLWMQTWNSESAEFTVELDKLVYESRDTVKAKIKLPEQIRKKKLIGIASIDGTTIFAHKCLDSDSAAQILEFPLKDNYAPKSALRVSLVDEDLNFHDQQTELKIYPKSAVLDVSVRPNKDKMEPGETAEFKVSAKTADGKPAQNTPVVLSVVDESIYAIAEETHPDVVQFFQATRPNYVNTFTAAQPVRVLTPTEVAWFSISPSEFLELRNSLNHLQPQTEGAMYKGGMAEDATAGAAAPAGLPAPPLPGAPVPEASRAATTQSGAASSSGKEPVIRSAFKDTAFFSGSILTDSKGEAIIKAKLPDNLTTWRASASLLNKESAAGYARGSVMTSKAMVARVSLPRFFTQDDRGIITAIVHNFTDKEQNVNLDLRLGSQFKPLLPTTQTITVAAQGAKRFTWPIDVIGEGKTKITLVAKGGGTGDALVQDLNILSHTFPAFAYHNGIIKDVNGKLEVPIKQFSDAKAATGQFTLKMSPSAIGPVLGNFDKLIDYPYGCTEQTMSRVMPSVVAMQLHNKLGLPLSKETQDLFKRVYHASLAKLVSHQSSDGGWGWWQGDTSNLYLTAYVMEGFHWLKASGFTYDQNMNELGNQWLEQRLNQVTLAPPSPEEMTDLSYAFYALSLDGRRAETFAHLKALAPKLNSGPEALSYLTLAYKNLGMDNEAKASYEALKELANQSWEYVNWEHTPELLRRMGHKFAYDYSYRFTPAETTALAFRAALVMEPTNEKYLASIRNWILMQHDENGWTNTKTTSQVFLALLSDEMKLGAKRPCNFEATASASGKTLASYLFNQGNRYSTEKILKLTLTGNEDKITIAKTGPGNLHYSSTLEYLRRIQKGQKVVPRSSPPDLTVERHFYKLDRYKIPKTDTWATRGILIDEKGIKTGDLILMKIKINAPFSMPYIKVEAPLPSGAEVISKQESIETKDPTEAADRSADASYFSYWWTHQDILDDRIVFFVTEMNAGKAEFQSLLRMEMPGELNANPVSFEGMYTKAIRGYSEADMIKVTESPAAE